MPKSIFIVGNGPVAKDISKQVDETDFVLRFNEPKTSFGMTGTKTNLLFINNSDKPMERRLNNPDYWTSEIVTNADGVVFVYCQEAMKRYVKKPKLRRRIRGRKADWTREAFEAYSAVGKFVTALPIEKYEQGYRELGLTEADAKRVFPSTGFFGIRHVLEHEADSDSVINICGFSFEGWSKHSWTEERQWLERKKDEHNFVVWP